MYEIKDKLNRKNICFYLFIIAMVADGILSTVTCFLSSYNIAYMGITGLFKITSIMELGIAIFYLLFVEKRVKMNWLSYAFCLFCVIGMITGAIYQQYNSKYFVHIFSHMMPIIIMAFASCFYQEYHKSMMLRSSMKRAMIVGAIVYIIGVVVFRILYFWDQVRYGAIGAVWGMFAEPFFMCDDSLVQIIWGYLMLAFSALSGKRSVLVGVVVAWICCMCMMNNKQKVLLVHILMTLSVIVGTIVLLLKTNVFSRILLTLTNIFGDNANLYLATSGRNYEIELIADYINKRPSMWLTGIGFGGKIWIQDVYRHYCHFSPLGYIMTGGIFESAIIYGILCWKAFKGMLYGIKGYLRNWEKPFVVQQLNAIIISLLGASLTATPIWWFFIGVAFVILDEKESGKDYVYSDR